MKKYSLSSLLNLRMHRKKIAYSHFIQAQHQHQMEEEKLNQIEQSIKKLAARRIDQQYKFILQGKTHPHSRSFIFLHLTSDEKHTMEQKELQQLQLEQTELVKYSALHLENAKKHAVYADQCLKTIEKHHSYWQQRRHKREEVVMENDSDDQNCSRFILNRALHELSR